MENFYMNEDELVANLFRINQTKQKILKDNVQGEKEAKETWWNKIVIFRGEVRMSLEELKKDCSKKQKKKIVVKSKRKAFTLLLRQ